MRRLFFPKPSMASSILAPSHFYSLSIPSARLCPPLHLISFLSSAGRRFTTASSASPTPLFALDDSSPDFCQFLSIYACFLTFFYLFIRLLILRFCTFCCHLHSDDTFAVSFLIAMPEKKEILHTDSKMLLKGLSYTELEKWVKARGYRPGQALMLWKRLYGDNVWAHSGDELEGLNKDFKKMLIEKAEFRALSLREILPSSDGTRKGMGEPLHNIDNVIKAANIMVDEQGLHFSPRKVTVSTSGLVPQLKRFLHDCNCALAVSLNATTDEVRNWIMPINRKYKLGLLLQTLREELRCKHNYKVLFEYVMLAGVNDSIEDAKRIVDLVQGIPCKINLISFNPHCGSQFRPTCKEKMIEFRNVLAAAGLTVLLRLSRGDDQMAACGQLGKPGTIQAPLLRVPDQFQMAMKLAP